MFPEAKKNIEIAKKLLLSNQQSKNKYAALELRIAIEKIVFEKLDFHKKYLPNSFKKIWQADKLFRLIENLEPDADKNVSVSIGKENVPGEPAKELFLIGYRKIFSNKWLRKNYNKLGKLLHADNSSISDEHRFLMSVYNKLEEVVSSNADVSMAVRLEFPCPRCNENIPINKEAFVDGMEVECLNSKCECINVISHEEESFKIRENGFEYNCTCKQQNFIAKKNLKIDSLIKCKGCDKLYIITHIKIKGKI